MCGLPCKGKFAAAGRDPGVNLALFGAFVTMLPLNLDVNMAERKKSEIILLKGTGELPLAY